MPTTKHTFCRICESLCGLEITLENEKITKIRPDNQHVATRGFGCPKGLKQHHLFNSPDRLKYPLMRFGKEWKRVSWEEALSDIGEKVQKIQNEYDKDSIAMYVGTAAGFGVLHPIFAQGFMDGIGSKSMYASATQDCSNKFAVAEHIYGFPFTQPFPDLHHANCLIVVGANPVVSKWSFLQVPNPSLHLKEMERRGAKIFFVDPRKTESAKVAGEHIFIRPGTDVFFYLAFLNELERIGGIDYDKVHQYMKGLDKVLQIARKWTPERTATVTQIPSETLRHLVTTYKDAKGAAIYCSTGVNMGGNGLLAFWLQEVINAVSGNLDKKGGTLVGRGVMDFAKFGVKNGILMKKDRSRVGSLRKVNDVFPGGLLADEILTPGKKQVRGLFVTGGNPLITMANSNRMRKAFQELDLLVTLDILPNETGSLATHQLPCTSPLQRPDLPFIFPLMLGLQAKPYLQATKAVVARQGEQRDEATIYLNLAKASKSPIFGSKIAQWFLEAAMKIHSRKLPKDAQPALPQEFLLNAILKLTGQKSFGRLLKMPHGWLRPSHQENDFLGKRVYTKDGLINLAPEILLQQTQKLEKDFLAEIANQNQLKLISKRHVRTHNSWTHNFEGFVNGEFQSNYLYMHSKDAEQRGLKSKDMVEVSSATGKVHVPIRILDDLMPGTVALPHGWGHQASHLSVAKKTKGVNVNILAADGADNLEAVSGMAHLTGIIVEVKKTEKTQAASWSGLQRDVLEV